MRYQSINNLIGWMVFAIALAIYAITLEPSVSMWDCGEFISAADKLQVVHQPGAPLFLMLGRFFSLFSHSREGVSIAVNLLSALCSAFTVLFTFWITTYFAAKIIGNSLENTSNRILIFISGIVAALALTFSDTFWFSAVEAEVYAMSSCFTALTFWAALKWEQSKSPYAAKWLILISYLIGLSIGTHLLSLLVVPSVAFIYYFKHYNYTRKGLFYCSLIGLSALLFIQKIVIPGIPQLMTVSDVFFVNSMGFPFWSGALFSLLLLMALLAFGIYYSGKINIKPYWNLACICLAYILLGYSSYAMVAIRSNESLPIDMGSPEDPINLTDYINRAQYEERPLLYGPYFNAPPIDIKTGSTIYRKDATQYTDIGEKRSYVYDPSYKVFFPRMSDANKESSPAGYRYWGGMSDVSNRLDQLERSVQEIQDPKQREEINTEIEELKLQKPSMLNNLKFFFNYQMNHMYTRYFMWNFAGRQNDRQGHSYNQYQDGNWISGITPIDNMRLGPQNGQPDYMQHNKGKNTFFLLPLILGILGFLIQFKKRRQDNIVMLVLFLFTGILINVFLNQPPFEPRERDYVHVGSFQIFCIWIGIGTLWIADRLMKKMSRLIAIILSAILAFSAPLIMAQQGWDDHDRSKRYLAIDFAKNCLNSCPPNAIFLANADNDTYPLWYAQNVEGVRRDVRIINQNLLPSDWYSKSLLNKVYDSEPLPLTLTKDQLSDGENDYFQFEANPSDKNPVDLRKFIQELTGTERESYHQRQFILPVQRHAVLISGVVKAADSAQIVNEIRFNFPSRGLHKGDLVLLDLIATNAETGWKRPICFSTIAGNDGFINLEPYFEQRGIIYQLVPIRSEVSRGNISRINCDDSYNLLMHQFRFSGMRQKKNFYLDDKADVAASSLQQLFVSLAADYLNKAEEIKFSDSLFVQGNNKALYDSYKQKAIELMDKCELEIPETVLITKGHVKFSMAAIRQATGHELSAQKHLKELFETCRQEVVYFSKFRGRTQDSEYMKSNTYQAFELMQRCIEYSKKWNYLNLLPEFEKQVKELEPIVKMYLEDA